MRPAWGTTRAMSEVVMKMPVPRIEPTVTRVASHTPSPFTSCGEGASFSFKVRGFYLDIGTSGTLAARMSEEIQIRPVRDRRQEHRGHERPQLPRVRGSCAAVSSASRNCSGVALPIGLIAPVSLRPPMVR